MVTRRRTAIYCRISQDREGAGLGVERQRADCEALAHKLGWTVADVYVDNDVSAYSGKPRPQYKRLLADVSAGRVSAILAWHTDRLHRSPVELEDFIAVIEARHVQVQTVTAGELDLSTPTGRMVARILGATARQEVEHKSERTKRAQLQAAQAGRWIGGAFPLGWQRASTHDPIRLDQPAARRIRKACADVLAGVSLGSIVAAWNAAGFTTGTYAHGCLDKAKCATRGRRNRGADCPRRAARAWNYTSLRQVLTRPRNAGLAEYGGAVVAESSWPVIVPEHTWRAVCSKLADPGRRKSQSNRVKHLLAGIAVCGKPGCGQPLKSATVVSNASKGTTRTVYRCPGDGEGGTGHVARAAGPLDALIDGGMIDGAKVRGVMPARLSRDDVADLLVTGEDSEARVDDLRAEATALRMRLGEVADEFADVTKDSGHLTRITRSIEARLVEIQAEMAAGARHSALAGIVDAADPARAYASASLERKRAIIRDLITVTVLPSGKRGNSFDPALVDVTWPGQANAARRKRPAVKPSLRRSA